MDRPSDYEDNQLRSSKRKAGRPARPSQPPPPPQLFQDTSMPQPPPHTPDVGANVYQYNPDFSQTGYTPEQPAGFAPNFINDPMANMAMQYGNTLADQGKDYVNKNLEKYVSSSRIKYYFAVDTAYVGKKLALVAFPFTHSDWSIKYNRDEPVAPQYEVNAPDLYIPVMAFVTYILVAGVCLGVQNKFSPEQLGIIASSALVWLVIEVVATLASLYFMNVKTDLTYLDLIAYAGYKYIGMIGCLLSGLLFTRTAYYIVLLWFSLSTAFFLMRTLHGQIQPHSHDGFSHGRKRTLYLTMAVALVQPALMWWITRGVLSLAR